MKTTANSAQRTLTATQVANNQNKSARQAVSQAQHSILYWVRALNAMASKNEFCDCVSILDLGTSIQSLLPTDVRVKMKTGQFFHACLFTQDYQGRACVVKNYTGTAVSLEQVQSEQGAVLTDAGREIVLSASGDSLKVLQPVSLSLSGVVSAFCHLNTQAARQTDAVNRAQARAQREEQKRQRQVERQKKALRRRFVDGELSARQYRVELAQIECQAA